MIGAGCRAPPSNAGDHELASGLPILSNIETSSFYKVLVMAERVPKIRSLDVFRVLLSTRSVTQTAQVLGISQPAVSKHLQQLEADLGFRLFERVSGRLHPTPEAELL